ncbi:MAG: AAA family ATPase [Alphaproteobacteria bacterium]|nr:AAA family ATPase [Alphaproteobacteria bacterium]MCW5740469.1 AAA family ATPase [Alphaproteobacteria bacterium]
MLAVQGNPHPSTAHVVEDQDEVLVFLANPSTHAGTTGVTRIDTHGAIVFLAGEHAYKVKRAVKFPFMDLSTLARRREACEAELRINRPNAPEIYLDTIPIVRRDGALFLGGPGDVVEWAVHMRRFDESRTLDRIAERGGLTQDMLERMADAVVDSQARAERRSGIDVAADLRAIIDGNTESLAESPELFAPHRVSALGRRSRDAIIRLAPALAERAQAGLVRRCHGDLHLRNMVMLGERPALFDALEFSEALATIDVLYDVAFLLMDLIERDLGYEASFFFNRYLTGWGDERQLSGLAALPLFISVRAAIRAKVLAAGLAHLDDAGRKAACEAAGRYLALAGRALVPAEPRLVAVGGLSGTGKSTVSARLAAEIGCLPGAVHLRSDVVRKRLWGVNEFDRLPGAAYDAQASDRVYTTLRRQAALALAAGYSVVVDAVHQRPEERDALRALAARLGAGFAGLWLDAPVDTLVARVERRARDASDARADTVALQVGRASGDIDWCRIDAAGDRVAVLERARLALRAAA